jgi:Flp pilus assembly protein TadB
MNDRAGNLSKAFQISGLLLIIGLCVETISLHWIHPLAFLAFFVIGGSFLAAGVLLFLYSILFHPSPARPRDSSAN